MGGRPVGARPPVRSAAVLRRGLGSVTTEWCQGTGGGRGLWWWGQFGRRADGRSTTRWRAPAAVGSPVRLSGVIGKGDGCVVLARAR
jgi:hypothetical protein